MKILKLDIDTRLKLTTLCRRLKSRSWVIRDFTHTWPEKITAQKSRHGWHVRIYLKKEMPARHVPFLQCALGSHFAREYYNYRRLNIPALRQPMRNWNTLFCVKWKNGKKVGAEQGRELDITKKIWNSKRT